MKNPKLIVKPFAKNGQKNVIPENYETSMESNQATWDQGFGQITMLPVAAGGLPPKGQDFNGIFNQISENIVYLSQGGRFKFSAEYAEAIGGYPKGAILQSDDEKKEYLSLIDNNKVDFNTASDISASWKLVNTDDLLAQIASKQPKGDYATKAELNSGLSGKQPTGDYATKTEVNSKLAKEQNGADIPNKPKFIENLGLEEWLKNQIEIPVGMFAAFPHRAIRLPPKWYSVNGDRFSVTSPQGKVLKGLSAEFKSDWGITESSGMINVPNIKQSDGRTAMLKPINGTSRQVGSVEQDMQRRLTGTFFSRPIYNAKGALGAVYKADGTFRTSQAAGDASTSPLMTNAATPEDRSDTITFDSGRQVPTGSENTVLNVGVTLAIYLGV